MPEDLIFYILVAIIAFGMLLLLLTINRAFEPDHSEDVPVIGTILIETSDPDGPFLFLDLSMPVDQIGTHSMVRCKVDTNGITGNESE